MIVTAIDEAFYPPLVALVNSVRRHSPQTPLACLTYGDDELARRVAQLGIEVRHNVDINAHLPAGEGTAEGCRPMYARLLAPLMFGDCAWLDADQVVVADLAPLFNLRFDETVAAVQWYEIQRGVLGMKAPAGNGVFAGLLRFNAEAWKRERITERCLELMNERQDVTWRFVVQSVLSVVLADRFHRLEGNWQVFANRRELAPTERGHVLHWHGRDRKPWTHPEMPNAALWRSYFCAC